MARTLPRQGRDAGRIERPEAFDQVPDGVAVRTVAWLVYGSLPATAEALARTRPERLAQESVQERRENELGGVGMDRVADAMPRRGGGRKPPIDLGLDRLERNTTVVGQESPDGCAERDRRRVGHRHAIEIVHAEGRHALEETCEAILRAPPSPARGR